MVQNWPIRRKPKTQTPVVPLSPKEKNNTMNWLDLVIILIVGVSAIMGLKIGMIRATLTTLAIIVGSILAVQLTDDISGLLRVIDADSIVATIISYVIVISLCLVVAAIASMVLIKVFDLLAMGWADKVAGVALGVIAGSVISAALIMGMANVTYSAETGGKIAAKLLDSALDTEKAKARLEDGLNKSAVVGILVNAVEIAPASTLAFIPANFTSGLAVVGRHQASGGD